MLTATLTSATRWHLRSATVFDADSDGRAFDGAIDLSSGDEVLFERIEKGALRIRINAVGTSVGKYYESADGDSIAASSRVVIVVSDFKRRSKEGETVVLPFSGTLRLGRAIARETSANVPLVLRATLRMLSKTWLWDTRFDAGAVELETGDSLTLLPESASAASMVRVSDERAMKVVAHALASAAIVSRYGSEGYQVRSSGLARLKQDPFVQLAWATFIFLIGLPKLLPERRDEK